MFIQLKMLSQGRKSPYFVNDRMIETEITE